MPGEDERQKPGAEVAEKTSGKSNTEAVAVEHAMVAEVAASLLAAEATPDAGAEISLEQKVKEELQKRHWLIIEDVYHFQEKLATDLTRERGSSDTTSAIAQATNGEDARRMAKEIIDQLKAGETLTLIADLTIPREEDTVPNEREGCETLEETQRLIRGWNTDHPDQQPVTLEILLNSSKTAEDTVADFFKRNRSQLDTSDIIGVNTANKNQGVSHLLKLLAERLK